MASRQSGGGSEIGVRSRQKQRQSLMGAPYTFKKHFSLFFSILFLEFVPILLLWLNVCL